MKTKINDRIKELRTALNLSQTEFAYETGISHSLLTKIEAGDNPPTNKVVSKIIDRYRVPESWLVSGVGEIKFEKEGKRETSFDPATDTLYKELKDQIAFYRTLLTQMAGGKSFRTALNAPGFPKRKSLRAAA